MQLKRKRTKRPARTHLQQHRIRIRQKATQSICKSHRLAEVSRPIARIGRIGDDIDLRRTFAPAIAAVQQISAAKIRICSQPLESSERHNERQQSE